MRLCASRMIDYGCSVRHSSIFDQDHLLAGDKDTWLIAAMLSRGGLHSASAQSQSSNWRSPVSAHPPGFLVLATDGSQNYMHDACKPVRDNLLCQAQVGTRR